MLCKVAHIKHRHHLAHNYKSTITPDSLFFQFKISLFDFPKRKSNIHYYVKGDPI